MLLPAVRYRPCKFIAVDIWTKPDVLTCGAEIFLTPVKENNPLNYAASILTLGQSLWTTLEPGCMGLIHNTQLVPLSSRRSFVYIWNSEVVPWWNFCVIGHLVLLAAQIIVATCISKPCRYGSTTLVIAGVHAMVRNTVNVIHWIRIGTMVWCLTNMKAVLHLLLLSIVGPRKFCLWHAENS